jgi:hypothetical protein
MEEKIMATKYLAVVLGVFSVLLMLIAIEGTSGGSWQTISANIATFAVALMVFGVGLMAVFRRK